MGGLRQRLAESGQAFRDVFTNPNLRRVQLAWLGSILGQWAFGIALAVYAYRAGGAAAVGLVGLIRTVPPAIVAPFVAGLADRFRRERVMLVSDVLRAVTIAAAAAVVFVDGPAGAVYALSGLAAIEGAVFKPAESAILPALARTPEELTAANVASSTIESVGSFIGPALGGLLLAVSGADVVFALTAAAFLWSAILVARIRSDEAEVPEHEAEPAVDRGGVLAGFRAIFGERDLRLLVILYAAQTLVAGALVVLVVVVALDLLDQGEAGVGILNAALGVGGLAGAVVALALVARRRLASDFALGIVLWGVPLAIIGFWPYAPVALAMLAVIGLGNTLVDVAGLTLLQRSVDDAIRARVFGVLESVLVGTIGLGAILAPLLVELMGARGALIATGAFLPILAALCWRRLVAMDEAVGAPGPEYELLRRVPLFTLLGPTTLEPLSTHLAPVRLDAGSDVFRQGDAGDRFYVVSEGEVDVTVDGLPANTIGPGGYFGEIALLRDVPRTATVTARTDVLLFALDREVFLDAVSRHPPSARAADAVVGARLGAARPGLAAR